MVRNGTKKFTIKEKTIICGLQETLFYFTFFTAFYDDCG